jgi:hypothetical protein
LPEASTESPALTRGVAEPVRTKTPSLVAGSPSGSGSWDPVALRAGAAYPGHHAGHIGDCLACEPRIKLILEHQAVARAHRTGRVRPVRVHRLLATGGVDERMPRMLEDKTRLFNAYARRRILEEEQARLGRDRRKAHGAGVSRTG